MFEILKVVFVGAFLIMLALSLLFLALIVLCSFMGAGVEGCRCLARWLAARRTHGGQI